MEKPSQKGAKRKNMSQQAAGLMRASSLKVGKRTILQEPKRIKENRRKRQRKKKKRPKGTLELSEALLIKKLNKEN